MTMLTWETPQLGPEDVSLWLTLCGEMDSYLEGTGEGHPFDILRLQDVTGISGTGVVAAGIQLPSGVILKWRGDKSSTTLHKNMDNVEAIHCHNGASKVRWKE